MCKGEKKPFKTYCMFRPVKLVLIKTNSDSLGQKSLFQMKEMEQKD